MTSETPSTPQSKTEQSDYSSGSQAAKNRSARLITVQLLYEYFHNNKSLRSSLSDVMEERYDFNFELEDFQIIKPNGVLLKNNLEGLETGRINEISEMVLACMAPTGAAKDSNDENKDGIEKDEISAPANPTHTKQLPEYLLRSILIAAFYEIITHNDIDAPIIINDYLDVTHAFYDQSQVRFVNGILDNFAKSVRS